MRANVAFARTSGGYRAAVTPPPTDTGATDTETTDTETTDIETTDIETTDAFDAVVVGGGPAGLAAAGWLARYRRRVLVVDGGEHRADRVERSHGYLGRDPQRPTDLLARGRTELLAYPTASVAEAHVRDVRVVDGPGPRFRLTLGDRRTDGWRKDSSDAGQDGDVEVVAHRVVLACGVRDALPDVPGIEDHYGASVLHCPSCDGYEARDADVVALGWDTHLAGFAADLLGWARSVTVVTTGRRFGTDDGDGAGGAAARRRLADVGVEVVEEEVTGLVGGRGALHAVRLASGREVVCSLAFFSVRHDPRTRLARRLGCELDAEGYVSVNECNMTTVEGVYAAGDVTPGLQLVQVAAAQGVVAGVACARSFQGTRPGTHAPAPPPEVATGREVPVREGAFRTG